MDFQQLEANTIRMLSAEAHGNGLLQNKICVISHRLFHIVCFQLFFVEQLEANGKGVCVMSKNKIFVLALIFIIIFICAGGFFMLNFNPGSLRYVMRKLDSYLETEYKYISTFKESEPTIEGIKPVTYFFEDINGVKFSVVTFPPFGDYDSSQPGYPRCDYLTAYYNANKDSIEKALQCGLPTTWVNAGIYASFRVDVSSYDELEIIAPAIEKALKTLVPVLSEKYSVSASDKFEFYIPEISVWTTDKDIISVFNFRLIKGQKPWTQEEILDELQNDYKKKTN